MRYSQPVTSYLMLSTLILFAFNKYITSRFSAGQPVGSNYNGHLVVDAIHRLSVNTLCPDHCWEQKKTKGCCCSLGDILDNGMPFVQDFTRRMGEFTVILEHDKLFLHVLHTYRVIFWLWSTYGWIGWLILLFSVTRIRVLQYWIWNTVSLAVESYLNKNNAVITEPMAVLNPDDAFERGLSQAT